MPLPVYFACFYIGFHATELTKIKYTPVKIRFLSIFALKSLRFAWSVAGRDDDKLKV
jgi:hypothetical protein